METGFLLEKLCRALIQKGVAKVEGVVVDGNLEAALLYTNWSGRLCYLFSVSSEKGKEIRAGFAIVYKLIVDYSNQPYVLDFEGSMDENISRFFKGFGAELEEYYEIKRMI